MNPIYPFVALGVLIMAIVVFGTGVLSSGEVRDTSADNANELTPAHELAEGFGISPREVESLSKVEVPKELMVDRPDLVPKPFVFDNAPEVALLYRVETSRLEIPLKWFSLEEFTYTGNPEKVGPAKWIYHDGKMVSVDVILLTEAELSTALGSFSMMAPGTRLHVPDDDRLVLFVESSEW